MRMAKDKKVESKKKQPALVLYGGSSEGYWECVPIPKGKAMVAAKALMKELKKLPNHESTRQWILQPCKWVQTTFAYTWTGDCKIKGPKGKPGKISMKFDVKR